MPLKSLEVSVEIASGLVLTNDTLDVQRLIGNRTITQDQFDALAAKGFHSLISRAGVAPEMCVTRTFESMV